MAPITANIKSEFDRFSATQTFNKSVSAFSYPVVNNGGYFTQNSSAAHQHQQTVMAENRTMVYQNALQKYKQLLEEGEGTKKDFLETRVKQIEENKRYEIETR